MTQASLSYVDVHTHLVHRQFTGEEDATALRAAEAGLEFVVVNGLDPASNRAVLGLCDRHSHLLPALGIYPLDAAAAAIASSPEIWMQDFEPPKPFDVEEEVRFIDSQAAAGRIIAVGECGLDGFYLKDLASLALQEKVLEMLVEVALRHDLPLILHTRKAERRTFEILQAHGVEKADFHCYGGKLKLAKTIADAGYYLSIPSAVTRIESFQRLAQELPLDRILTETDAPYMGPERNSRNEPSTVPLGVAAIAKARGEDLVSVASAIHKNFHKLFRPLQEFKEER